MSSPQEQAPIQQRTDYFGTDHLKAFLGRRALRGGAITVVGQAMAFGLSLVSTIILARLLTPQDFGLVAMVAPVLTFMGFFRDLGLSTATVQQAEIDHAQISTLFWLNLGLSAGLMLLAGAISPLVALFYHRSEVAWLTMAYGFNCLLTGASIQHTALLRRQMSFGLLAVVNLVSNAIGVGAGILSAAGGMGYWSLAIMSLASSLASLVGVWWLCAWRPGRPVRGSGVRPMLRFGGFLTVGNLAYFAASSLDALAIGRWLGAVPLGNYNRANQVFMVALQQLSSPLAAVAIPALSRLQDDPARYKVAFLRSVRALALGTVPLACAMIAGGDGLTLLLLGKEWTEAAALVRILAVFGLVFAISGAVSWLLITQGRGKTLMYWSLASFFITLVTVAVGLQWGVFGIAVGIAIKGLLSFVIFTLLSCSKGPVTAGDVFRAVRIPMTSGIAGLAVALLLRSTLLMSLSPILQAMGAIVAVALVSLLVLLGTPAHRLVVMETVALGRAMFDRSSSSRATSAAEVPSAVC